ncbi:hypothetical protein EI427_02870 [Flammeovirga pectinis]|uniref:Hpt domain-containing protein n=1 Tax=Flammeovirga pectinis TaxID=2494373 RepID=A0A3S9NZ39_9BACT|nr:hypothetical protein [Flammeovirga pectinis]AZQ61199.1 hypothetical protein EI427_02870 [Flammeovirga pectinis]
MIENVDFSGLYDVSDGDEEFLVSVLMVIEKNLKSYPNEIQELLDANQLIDLGKKAHKLKSSIAYLKHKLLEELLLFLEEGEIHNATVHQEKLTLFKEVVSNVLIEVQAKIEELD